MTNLSDVDIVALDYSEKIEMLEKIAQMILSYQVEFAEVSGKYAVIKANLQVLKEVKSAIQSALKAESQQ